MDLVQFKLSKLGIDKAVFGKIYSFVDFGNVNYWYEYDERGANGNMLQKNSKLVVGIEELSTFINSFSEHKRFYFGLDPKNPKSIKIISKAREYFDNTITKPIQWIRHYLNYSEEQLTTRAVKSDSRGRFILIPKCNFDVEICIDAVRFLDEYQTYCLFSSDADFSYLLEFLKRKQKKIILFSAGYITHFLKKKADLNINSQLIKGEITYAKQKPRL